MIVTEAEAGTKWCPFFRRGSGGNADADGKNLAKCVGSECMMWRWAKMVTKAFDSDDRRGFCGLGGES